MIYYSTEFPSDLKDHILACLLGLACEYDFTDDEQATVIFKDNRIYSHKVLRVNYTTYDVHQAQDSINPMLGAYMLSAYIHVNPNQFLFIL